MLTDLQIRVLTFLVGCMGARFSIVYVAKTISPRYLPYLGGLALAICLGLAVIYINGWRKTGVEVRGDRIWWNAMRPIHAALWGVSAVLAFARNRAAWIPLLVDALMGLTAFVAFHTGRYAL